MRAKKSMTRMEHFEVTSFPFIAIWISLIPSEYFTVPVQSHRTYGTLFQYLYRTPPNERTNACHATSQITFFCQVASCYSETPRMVLIGSGWLGAGRKKFFSPPMPCHAMPSAVCSFSGWRDGRRSVIIVIRGGCSK